MPCNRKYTKDRFKRPCPITPPIVNHMEDFKYQDGFKLPPKLGYALPDVKIVVGMHHGDSMFSIAGNRPDNLDKMIKRTIGELERANAHKNPSIIRASSMHMAATGVKMYNKY